MLYQGNPIRYYGLYQALIRQQDIMQFIIDDYAEFLGMPRDEVVTAIQQGPQQLARAWHKRHPSLKDNADFYRDNRGYLFDLAFFNLDPRYYTRRISPLVEVRKSKILDIGCGIGTLAFMLAEQDNEVVGWDINKILIDFCEFKKRKYNLGGVFTTEKPDYGNFDFIVAVDTLEHIEDLGGFLKALGEEVKTGTKFYHSDCFGFQNINPMHLDHSQSVRGWIEDAGFEYCNELWAIKR